MQLGQLQKIEGQLVQLGYQVIAISPDRTEKLRDSIQKHQLNYLLLSDSQLTGAQAFGIAFKVDEKTVERYRKMGIELGDVSGEKVLPVPTVFLIGTDGIIKFEYVNPNYKVRLDPDVLLAAAKAALK